MFNTFVHAGNKPAIIDAAGMCDYDRLGAMCREYTDHLRQNSYAGKRILLKGNNHRSLVALMIALAETGNEVIMQEPKSTDSETTVLIDLYRINYVIDADSWLAEKRTIEKHSSFDHSFNDPKIYYFSSGSTGIPKLFGYTPKKLITLIRNWTSALQMAGLSVMCPLTITHHHGTMVSFAALMYGNTLIFCKAGKLDPQDIKELMEHYAPGFISGTPYLYQSMLNYLDGSFTGFRNIRYAVCGSAPMAAGLAESFYSRFGIYLNQAYGLSEIGPICIDLQPSLGLGTVGKVLPGIKYRIADDADNDVPVGTEGELIVTAPYMVDGYLEAPDQTAEMFKNGWLYTKDIVRQDDLGRIIVVGRKSSFINISGFKVFPAEIEKVIMSLARGSRLQCRKQQ